MVAFTDKLQYCSNEIQIKPFSEASIELKRLSSDIIDTNIYELYEFGINLTLICAIPDFDIYSKVIEIAPRYVIINMS